MNWKLVVLILAMSFYRLKKVAFRCLGHDPSNTVHEPYFSPYLDKKPEHFIDFVCSLYCECENKKSNQLYALIAQETDPRSDLSHYFSFFSDCHSKKSILCQRAFTKGIDEEIKVMENGIKNKIERDEKQYLLEFEATVKVLKEILNDFKKENLEKVWYEELQSYKKHFIRI